MVTKLLKLQMLIPPRDFYYTPPGPLFLEGEQEKSREVLLSPSEKRGIKGVCLIQDVLHLRQ
jgi:hypothetical protein